MHASLTDQAGVRCPCRIDGVSGVSDFCEWFGLKQRRATIHRLYYSCAVYSDQDFTAEPECIAVDETQIQLKRG